MWRAEFDTPKWLWWSKPMGSHFGDWVNSPPMLEPILVVGLVDVHWGRTDSAFDPWPTRTFTAP